MRHEPLISRRTLDGTSETGIGQVIGLASVSVERTVDIDKCGTLGERTCIEAVKRQPLEDILLPGI